MNSGPQMIGAHRLYQQLGFTRLPERKTRLVDGHLLFAFGLDLPNPQPISPVAAPGGPHHEAHHD
jgi:hypothetical protein